MERIGFIGLGRIGEQLALNLLSAGVEVVGCDLSQRPRFLEAGGSLVETPRQVAQVAEIILQSLSGPEALREVIGGRDGLMRACGPDHILADLSFYRLADKMAAADQLRELGAILLDCQITGTPEMLARRAGSIFISGDAAAAARCQKVFAAAIDHQTFISAEFGAATRLKTANNLLVALNTVAAAEALALALAGGINPQTALDVIGAGAGQSQMFLQRAPLMIQREYPATSSTLGSFEIFLDSIEDDLKRARQSGPLAKVAMQIYRQAIAAGHAAEDMACIFEIVAPPAAPDDAMALRN
jgi:3-hydroxyisobutyrate dehydrogenase